MLYKFKMGPKNGGRCCKWSLLADGRQLRFDFEPIGEIDPVLYVEDSRSTLPTSEFDTQARTQTTQGIVDVSMDQWVKKT